VALKTMPSENGMSAAPALVADTPSTLTRKSGRKIVTDMNEAPKKNVVAFAVRKTRLRKSRMSRMGLVDLRERSTNAASRSAPAPKSVSVTHPLHG
jgi:hypothetical protein